MLQLDQKQRRFFWLYIFHLELIISGSRIIKKADQVNLFSSNIHANVYVLFYIVDAAMITSERT